MHALCLAKTSLYIWFLENVKGQRASCPANGFGNPSTTFPCATASLSLEITSWHMPSMVISILSMPPLSRSLELEFRLAALSNRPLSLVSLTTIRDWRLAHWPRSLLPLDGHTTIKFCCTILFPSG